MSMTDLARMVSEVPDRSLAAIVQRRVLGSHEIDPWGLDADLVALLEKLPVCSLVARIEGAGDVPDGPALLVVRAPAVLLGPVVVGLGSALGRPVRFVGVPDTAITNSVLHRLGGVQGHEPDVRGLLRSGSLVLTPRAGIEAGALPAAVAMGAPVVPISIRPGLPPRVQVRGSVPTRRRGRARDVAEVLAAIDPPAGGPGGQQ